MALRAGLRMRDRLLHRIAAVVPARLRERVFIASAHDAMRRHRARRRRVRTPVARLALEARLVIEIGRLAIECRALARAEHRQAAYRPSRGGSLMIVPDLRFAVRMLRKSPGFTLAAVVTLALGIGATAAIFSVVEHVLLRPLPYPAADRVMDVNEFAGGRPVAVSPPNFIDWRAENRTFASMAMYQEGTLTVSGGTAPERIEALYAEPGVFEVLASRPVTGRVFTPEDARPGAAKVTVISHALWQRRFGADAGVIGRSITIEGEPYRVVGIMPAGFQFRETTDAWVPLVLRPSDTSPNQRGAHYVNAIGRVKDGITAAQAQADLDGIERRLAAQYPDKLEGYSMIVRPLLESMVGSVRRPLLVLLGAVAFVLLIACVNVSNLLLARATTRTGEIAVRSALGAGRSRIVRQLLAESLVLSAASGAGGLLLAMWGVRLLALVAPEDLPRGASFAINPLVLVFAIAVSLVTGLAFGLVPALVSSRTDLGSFLKDMRRDTSTGGRGHVRNVLVAAEVSLALVLLAGAGLTMRSFDRLARVDPGFDPHNVLAFTIRVPEARYTTLAATEQFFRDLTARLRQPGIVSAAGIFLPPLSHSGFGGTFYRLDTPGGEQEANAQVRPVTANYFETLRIPLLSGRRITSQDRAGGPGVAVISEAAARAYWPNENPLGKRIRIGVSMGVLEQPREVVGVIGDVRTRSLELEPVPVIYVPETQYVSDEMTIVARTAGDPLAALPIVKAQLALLDREVAISRVRTMESVVAQSVAQPRFRTTLLAAFASVSLMLAAIGVYGMVAFSVNQRRTELGLRLALGAKPHDLLRLVLWQGIMPVAIGLACGLAAAVAVTRVMQTLLFGVSALDSVTFGAVASMLLVVAMGACYVPARQAMTIDAVSTLR
jgi:putative ABC transport system permease protein